jgi:hypothetical protein
MLQGEETTRNKAQLSLTLERESASQFYFRITNVGEAEARNVEMQIALDDPDDSPIIADEYIEKFPVKRLPPVIGVRQCAGRVRCLDKRCERKRRSGNPCCLQFRAAAVAQGSVRLSRPLPKPASIGGLFFQLTTLKRSFDTPKRSSNGRSNSLSKSGCMAVSCCSRFITLSASSVLPYEIPLRLTVSPSTVISAP